MNEDDTGVGAALLPIDHESWDYFEAFALMMLRADGPLEPPPAVPVEQFKGTTSVARGLIDLYRREGRPGVWRGLAPLMADYPHLAAVLTREPHERAALHELEVYTADELKALPPVAFLDADRCIQAGGITMLVGQPGAGKSLWMLRKLHELSATLPVLLIAAEAQGGLSDRLMALERATLRPIAPVFHISPRGFNLRDDTHVEALIRLATARQVRVIAFDTYAAVTAGADENSVREVTPVFAVLERIKAAVGCAILLIHHTRKDGAVYRGSSAIHGALDNLYVLRDDNGTLELKAEKTRDTLKPPVQRFRVVEFETRPGPDGVPVRAPALLPAAQVVDEDDPPPPRLTANERKVLEALDAYEAGMTPTTLQEVTQMTEGVFYSVLRGMVERGSIIKDVRGHKHTIYTISATGRASLQPEV